MTEGFFGRYSKKMSHEHGFGNFT